MLDLLEAREAARREVHELGQAIAAALLVSSARARSPSMRDASRAARGADDGLGGDEVADLVLEDPAGTGRFAPARVIAATVRRCWRRRAQGA